MGVRRVLRCLIAPTCLIAAAAAGVWQWPAIDAALGDNSPLRPVLGFVPFLPYAIVALGFLVSVRMGSMGLTLACCALGFGHLVLADLNHAAAGLSAPTAPELMRFLVPLDLALFALLAPRRLRSRLGIVGASVFGLQLALCALLTAGSSGVSRLEALLGGWAAAAGLVASIANVMGAFLRGVPVSMAGGLPACVLIAFGVGLLVTGGRLLRRKSALDAGLLGAVVGFALLATASDPVAPQAALYSAAGGLCLLIGMLEASLTMAYVDELTGLPGRRRLTEELRNLRGTFSVAMIDADRFKRLNDRHGHYAGDQALRMIAGLLARIGGGARVFRYGGEEFAVLFPGKEPEEAVPHLEEFRKSLETRQFVVRGNGAAESGKSGGGARKSVKVTVSIGLAGPGKKVDDPEEVLNAADRALYNAKRAGRNRLSRSRST